MPTIRIVNFRTSKDIDPPFTKAGVFYYLETRDAAGALLDNDRTEAEQTGFVGAREAARAKLTGSYPHGQPHNVTIIRRYAVEGMPDAVYQTVAVLILEA